MNYLLLVLTHGDAPTLEDCLDSYGENVEPLPDRVVILRDGPGYSYIPRWAMSCPLGWFMGQLSDEQLGFCAATRAAWEIAARASDYDYVFWLEHDFLFTRGVDLTSLAVELDHDRRLAQMALMRDAVNEQEKAAGGLFESRRDGYTLSKITAPYEAEWLTHRMYFTTNPSLMRAKFIRDHPWPKDQSECEGKHGIELVARGYRFGVWGAGEPWVKHIGVRDGFGY